MSTLSCIYADQPLPLPPVFYKRSHTPLSYPLSPADHSLVMRYTPHVQTSYPLAEVLARYAKEVEETTLVDLYFSSAEMDAIWKMARDAGGNGDYLREKLTRQDALTAYLVTLHNRCLEQPIHTVMNLMDVRSFINSSPHISILILLQKGAPPRHTSHEFGRVIPTSNRSGKLHRHRTCTPPGSRTRTINHRRHRACHSAFDNRSP